jgi:iron(III) transport system substrate-binding protein
MAASAAGALPRTGGLRHGDHTNRIEQETATMKKRTLSRRDVLQGSAAVAVGAVAGSTKVLAAAPPATAITPELIAAAKKEGKLAYYTSIDLPIAEKIAKTFEAKFPGISVRVERTGAERVFQRIGQEYGSNIHAVDVVNSSDAAQFVVWRRQGILQPFVPEDLVKHYKPDQMDAEGLFASFRVGPVVMAYNTNLVKAADAPKSFADLLDPKWAGKIVKAHPGYSGNILTATYEMSRDLGWGYFEKLAKQRVMQVQSAADPPKKLALGERAIQADGNEYNLLQIKQSKGPVEIIYPTEGAPFVVGPNAIFKQSPSPNAARLFQCWCFTAECQQLIVDFGKLRSLHPLVKETDGRKPIGEIKFMKEDAAAVEKMSEEIKARYSKLFGV